MHYSADEALGLLRDGIMRYNVARGVANTETSGYHETITRFYVWVIDRYLKAADRSRMLDQLANELIAVYGDKDLPLRYYSRERLMSNQRTHLGPGRPHGRPRAGRGRGGPSTPG